MLIVSLRGINQGFWSHFFLAVKESWYPFQRCNVTTVSLPEESHRRETNQLIAEPALVDPEYNTLRPL